MVSGYFTLIIIVYSFDVFLLDFLTGVSGEKQWIDDVM